MCCYYSYVYGGGGFSTIGLSAIVGGTIKYQTFAGFTSLTKIRIPDKVKTIEPHSFVRS